MEASSILYNTYNNINSIWSWMIFNTFQDHQSIGIYYLLWPQFFTDFWASWNHWLLTWLWPWFILTFPYTFHAPIVYYFRGVIVKLEQLKKIDLTFHLWWPWMMTIFIFVSSNTPLMLRFISTKFEPVMSIFKIWPDLDLEHGLQILDKVLLAYSEDPIITAPSIHFIIIIFSC